MCRSRCDWQFYGLRVPDELMEEWTGGEKSRSEAIRRLLELAQPAGVLPYFQP